MRKLIAVRHGSYDMPPYTGCRWEEWERAKSLAPLNESGRLQSRGLAKYLQMVVQDGETASIVTSTHVRAVETATIVGTLLGVTPKAEGYFRLQMYRDGDDLMWFVSEIAEEADVVIVIMHHEAISGMMNAFCMKYFNKKVEKQEFGHCSGMMLNMVTGAVIPFP